MLHLALASGQSSADSFICNASAIYENRRELREAASGVTACLKELIQLRLARWLPSNAVACTALPLVLHILDAKLSSPRTGTTGADGHDSQSALKQHRLDALVGALETSQPQYDGKDWVSETIKHLVNLAQPDGAHLRSNETLESQTGNSEIHNCPDWTDTLTSHPGLYLRLALTMDLSLGADRHTEEGDFLASLRSLLAGDSNDASPLSLLFSATKEQQQQHRHEHPLHPIPGSISSIPPEQPRAIDPATMRSWLETDMSVSYAIRNGIDMDLDETSPRPGGGGQGYSDSESGSLDESYEESADEHHLRDHGHHGRVRNGDDQQGQGQQQHQQGPQQGSPLQPFAAVGEEEMEGLVPHVLDAFTMQDETLRVPEGAIESGIEIFGDALGADVRILRLLGC